jgi:hypothetical protein
MENANALIFIFIFPARQNGISAITLLAINVAIGLVDIAPQFAALLVREPAALALVAFRRQALFAAQTARVPLHGLARLALRLRLQPGTESARLRNRRLRSRRHRRHHRQCTKPRFHSLFLEVNIF